MLDEPIPPAQPVKPPRFFEQVDWLAFGISTFLTLLVYVISMAPEVTLDYSGIYCPSAQYPGPSIPPGHPIWVLYGWLFIHLIPFSNIAWRLGFSSAVAGALTCGLVALLVSRIGLMTVGNFSAFNALPTRNKTGLRVVCGAVAGLGLGLDSSLWAKAVVVDTWPLSLLLLAISLCLLTRWFFRPAQRYPLYAVFFTTALMFVESQALAPAAMSFIIFIVLGDMRLGRDILLCVGLCFWLVISQWSIFRGIYYTNFQYMGVVFYGAILCTLIGGGLCIKTRRVFTEWKAVTLGTFLFLVGLCAYFLMTIYSMSDPPVNWGYPRTLQGYFHSVRREQFCVGDFRFTWSALSTEWEIYFATSVKDFGLAYLMAALVPPCFIFKISSMPRKWVVGLVGAFFLTNFLMLAGLNAVTWDRWTIAADAPYFAASHLLLAILAGTGFMLVAVFFARPVSTKEIEASKNQISLQFDDSTI